jgi:hypothetical protein
VGETTMNKKLIAMIGLMAILLVAQVFAVTEVVTLSSPSNTSGYTNDRRPDFKFYVTNPTNASVTCDLQVDSTLQWDDYSTTNNTVTNLQSTSALADGIHTWNVTCVGLGLSPETNSSATWNYNVGFEYNAVDIPKVVVDNFVGILAAVFALTTIIAILLLFKFFQGKKIM